MNDHICDVMYVAYTPAHPAILYGLAVKKLVTDNIAPQFFQMLKEAS